MASGSYLVKSLDDAVKGWPFGLIRVIGGLTAGGLSADGRRCTTMKRFGSEGFKIEVRRT